MDSSESLLEIKMARPPNKDMLAGNKHQSTFGWFIIIKYSTSKNIEILFDGSDKTMITTNERIRSGNLKNPSHKSVYGVGYFGYGEHRAKIGNRDTKVYKVWHGMFQRCYSDGYKNTSYDGCIVCPEWHNFQTFAVWFHDNYIAGFELDKDSIVVGNKIYSPTTCKFLSKMDNAALQSACKYTVQMTNGIESVTFTNQRKFCIEHNLCHKAINAVIKGRTKQHKQWRLL